MLIHSTPLLSLLEGKHLYLDPGTGSIFLQMTIASVLGLAVVIRTRWKQIKKIFINKASNSNGEEEGDD